MSRFPPLADLGNRIVIMGPSSAGKSTLAQALGDALSIPAIHLDQLHHLPHTDWVPRPREDFHALQRDAIARECWVMDGNYSALLPERLARATGAIVLDEGRWMRLARYGRRTLFQRYRAGALEGNKDRIKWSMIHWVLVGSRYNGARYRELVDAAGLPHIYCHSMGELRGLYRHWGLQRPAKT